MTHQDHKIRVDVETSYLDEQSDPRERRFAFSYTITIRNEGQVPAIGLNRRAIRAQCQSRRCARGLYRTSGLR